MKHTIPSLGELRRRFVTEGRPVPADLERALREDTRQGVQAILAAVDRRRRANRAEGQRLRRMLEFERRLWADGVRLVAGVDEAGMSPLAGPVVAAAVVLPENCRIRRVDDSKKLAPEVRDSLAEEIKHQAVAWAVGMAAPEEIDQINIYHAGLLAMQRAVLNLTQAPQALLVDARRIPEVTAPQEPLVKGDSRSLSIAAASIIAKTTRDAAMVSYDAEYPGYGFAAHKGYPVPEHKAAIRRLGVVPIHRRSFAFVAEHL